MTVIVPCRLVVGVRIHFTEKFISIFPIFVSGYWLVRFVFGPCPARPFAGFPHTIWALSHSHLSFPLTPFLDYSTPSPYFPLHRHFHLNPSHSTVPSDDRSPTWALTSSFWFPSPSRSSWSGPRPVSPKTTDVGTRLSARRFGSFGKVRKVTAITGVTWDLGVIFRLIGTWLGLFIRSKVSAYGSIAWVIFSITLITISQWFLSLYSLTLALCTSLAIPYTYP